MTDLAMPQIVHQQEDVMVEVLFTTVPLEQDPATEGVPQIRQTRAWARAPTFNACRQNAERVFCGVHCQARASQRNKKGVGCGNASVALAVVSEQLLEGAGMKGQDPNLVQLAVTHGDNPR